MQSAAAPAIRALDGLLSRDIKTRPTTCRKIAMPIWIKPLCALVRSHLRFLTPEPFKTRGASSVIDDTHLFLRYNEVGTETREPGQGRSAGEKLLKPPPGHD